MATIQVSHCIKWRHITDSEDVKPLEFCRWETKTDFKSTDSF